jgi:hypothetical protein
MRLGLAATPWRAGVFLQTGALVSASEVTELVFCAVVLIGVGATLVMDLWPALLRRAGIPSLSFVLLGRWIGHLPQGQLTHERIERAPPVRGERVLGWNLREIAPPFSPTRPWAP